MANWDKITGRGNVEDRRGMAIGGFGGLGLTGIIIVLALNLLGGGAPSDLNDILSQLQTQSAQQTVDPTQFEGADEYEKFATAVLGSNDETWRDIFAKSKKTYE